MVVLVRQPRAFIDLGGGPMPVKSCEWTRKSVRAADTFSVSLPVGKAAQFGFGYAEFADFQPEEATISASSQIGGGDLTQVMTGQIDKPEIDWDKQTVTISGRDKSASLTENRRSQAFKNQMSSDIVSTIAQSRGLGVSFVAGTGFAGKVFADYVFHALNQSDYHIVSDLAEREDYRWYVDGSTLYFEPKEQLTDVYPFTYIPPSVGSYGIGDCWGLKTSRNKTAAKPHQVTVKSWNSKDKKLYKSTASMGGIGSDIAVEYHHNGKNMDQVTKLANSRLDNLTRHDCSASWSAAGDLSLDVRQKTQLGGTGTIYDQTYDIDEVRFSMDWDAVFTMALSCKSRVSGRS